MFGAHMGTLYVEVSTDDCETWTVFDQITGQQQTAWTKPWRYGLVTLPVDSRVRIRFRGVTGPGEKSDMAIDDLRVGEIPQGICCVPADNNCLTTQTMEACLNQGGSWVQGGTCAADCGVCCLEDGTCLYTSQPDCTGASWTAGQACSDTSCQEGGG